MSFELVSVRRSSDGTRKLLLALEADARVECVLIPMTPLREAVSLRPARGSPTRVTLCISTQVGCAMGCVFCASGRLGLGRGLSAGEIVAQVEVARGLVEPGEELRNLVFMGMGEPLHHYDETAAALRRLMDPNGLNIGPRRITVSTVGLVPGIQRLGRDFDGKIGLAVSLHAPDDATRTRILPMNRRYPIAELLRALREYPLPRRRRIAIEYTLIEGVNDAPEHALRLAELLRGIPVKINLIAMNPIAGSELRAASASAMAEFQSLLAASGYSCFVRARRGDELDAACGQLALGEKLVRARPSAAAP